MKDIIKQAAEIAISVFIVMIPVMVWFLFGAITLRWLCR